ncbi:hypothetical protein GIB67_022162 [Kingdonia uniflora]|uniref:Plectin/eS10 N-terminal domain-containing protein n=1 Tax=Kingdonia uniflora TaxID=39325 RepID=A0A7J7N8X4_9MAGN|nr:hypothetical protein GIB67_022162 [Kingdonia uniflora]
MRRRLPNLQVIKLTQSFKSKEYVRETFAWQHYYWYLTNEGIEFLRTFLNLPSKTVPATLKKYVKPMGHPMGDPGSDRPRFAFIDFISNELIWFFVFLDSSKTSKLKIMRFIFQGPPCFEGNRPRFGDRDGYRRGEGEFGGDKTGTSAEYQPSFRLVGLELRISKKILPEYK